MLQETSGGEATLGERRITISNGKVEYNHSGRKRPNRKDGLLLYKSDSAGGGIVARSEDCCRGRNHSVYGRIVKVNCMAESYDYIVMLKWMGEKGISGK